MGNAIFNITLIFTLYILELIISFQFFSAFLFHKKYRYGFNATIIITLSALLTIINLFSQPIFLQKKSILIALFLIGFFLFETDIYPLLFSVAILTFASILSDEISEVLTHLLPYEMSAYISHLNLDYLHMSIVSKIIWISAIRIIMNTNQRNKNSHSLYGMNSLLLFPAILSINMILMVSLSSIGYTNYFNLLFVIIVGVLGLLSCISIFRIYEFSLVQNELANDLRRKQSDIDYYNSQVQNLETLMNRQHEYKNSLTTIKGMLGSNIDPDVNAYLNELIGAFNADQELAITENFNNKVVNAILNYNRNVCKSRNIQLDIDIQHFDMGFLRPLDTGLLLNNSFNNAIEACNLIPTGSTKWIKLKICLLHDELIIAMRNSKNNTIIHNKSRIMSTKNRALSTCHGQGITNMKKCASRYKGSLNITDGGDYFELFIRLKCISN